jgi:putrescine transport system permease protein
MRRPGLRIPGRALVLGLPYAWLLLFFLAPFALVLRIALAEARIAQPPYSPLIERVGELSYALRISLANFAYLVQDSLYWSAFLGSVRVALGATLLCLLLGYPLAYGMARAKPRLRPLLLMLVVLPFWTSFLIRVYAWKVILQKGGVLNAALL